MAQVKFGSAGVTTKEIDISGVVTQEPAGVPAGVIGTTKKGPAFVPVTVGTIDDFNKKFGASDGEKFGPLAANEWLRNSTSLTYIRVLGTGDGQQRVADGQTAGSVTSAGFIVGEKQPLTSNDGLLSANPYANLGGAEGRTYFLGAFMSASAGSTVFSEANLQNSVTSSVILRGILMAPSGVLPRLASYTVSSNAPASTLVAADATAQGGILGDVALLENSTPKQEFVLLLNGHKGTDSAYPNVITASFDVTANNYFAKALNTDPYKLQQAGHCLYANWDVHPTLAVVTGSGLIHANSGSGATEAAVSGSSGKEVAAFLTTGSLNRNVGSSTVPNYELFADRFSAAKSPWIVSQKFGGSPLNLFRFHALDHGANISTLYKISIENIVVSTDPLNLFGSFDVVLRSWSDRDTAQLPLERFSGVNLDPNSDRYIAKIIGDANVYYDFDRIESAQRLMVEGNYTNQSNYVRVEVDSTVENENIPPTALPVGFRGISHLATSGSAPMTSPSLGAVAASNVLKRTTTPALQFRKNITIGSGTKKSVEPQYYWGVQFEHIDSLTTPNASTLANDSMKSFAKFFPDFSTTNMNFAVGDNTGAVDTDANGVVDADKFCLNMFSLENIKVVTGSTGLADTAQWKSAEYVRDGNITTDDSAKTRAFQVTDLIQANRKFAKFSLFMQGGFDGVNIFDRDENTLSNAAATADIEDVNRGQNNGPTVKAYAKALEVIQNQVNADIQLLAMPGMRHSYLTNLALSSVEDRFDALYIMDIEQYDSDNALVTSDTQLPSVEYTVQALRDRSLNSSFGAAYFPDVVMTDPTVKTNVVVPPSVAVLGALANNDALAYPWFAPAGTTRGALSTALEARVKLSKNDMDQLYDVAINPLVAFPGNASVGTNPKGGVVVWGQKTLLSTASSLDRINVRRLLIDLRRQIRDISNFIVFEPSRESTLARFTELVTPRLQRIQKLAGIDQYKVIIDSSTTTEADVLNNTLRGVIYVQPRKAIEFVQLDFVVTNAGAQI